MRPRASAAASRAGHRGSSMRIRASRAWRTNTAPVDSSSASASVCAAVRAARESAARRAAAKTSSTAKAAAERTAGAGWSTAQARSGARAGRADRWAMQRPWVAATPAVPCRSRASSIAATARTSATPRAMSPSMPLSDQCQGPLTGSPSRQQSTTALPASSVQGRPYRAMAHAAPARAAAGRSAASSRVSQARPPSGASRPMAAVTPASAGGEVSTRLRSRSAARTADAQSAGRWPSRQVAACRISSSGSSSSGSSRSASATRAAPVCVRTSSGASSAAATAVSRRVHVRRCGAVGSVASRARKGTVDVVQCGPVDGVESGQEGRRHGGPSERGRVREGWPRPVTVPGARRRGFGAGQVLPTPCCTVTDIT